ncbi:MAG: hypothetical protein ABR526_07170 [Chthoniobacterales bacterium]
MRIATSTAGLVFITAGGALFAQPRVAAPALSAAVAPASVLNEKNTYIRYDVSETGAAITIVARDPANFTTAAAISMVASTLSAELRKNRLESLFNVVRPDRDFAAALKANGGIGFSVGHDRTTLRVTMTASDQRSRTTIHNFIRAEDPGLTRDRRVDHPGNNLGWDAPPRPDLSK